MTAVVGGLIIYFLLINNYITTLFAKVLSRGSRYSVCSKHPSPGDTRLSQATGADRKAAAAFQEPYKASCVCFPIAGRGGGICPW